MPAPPPDAGLPWDKAGIHGLARPREWDAVVHADAPGLPGNELSFTVLPGGSLLVHGDVPEAALAPVVEALGDSVRPPYRAEAVRRTETGWAVAARAIEVVELPEAIGDDIELVSTDGERTLVVDDRPSFTGVPALERLAEARYGASFAVQAKRLERSLYEVRVSPL